MTKGKTSPERGRRRGDVREAADDQHERRAVHDRRHCQHAGPHLRSDRTRAGRVARYHRRVRFALRILSWITAALALPVVLAAIGGRLGAVVGVALAVLGTLWLWLWLPRSAHAAFEAGRFARAARRYRVLGVVATSAARERSIVLSRTGCCVAMGELAAAERLLERIDGDALDSSERAVWLNNRACVALARQSDPAAALALIDEASALRPDVPALQHTRGMALLAVGRVDDAIAVLDGMRAGGELPPRLEADRCRDLSRAWDTKGETAYAEDYRVRAAAHSR